MNGSTYRSCSCRDTNRHKLGKACPKLKDRHHGSWAYVIDLPAGLDSKRNQLRRSGFPTKTKAGEAMDEVIQRLDQGQKINDRESVAEYLDAWLKAKRRLRPTTRRSYVEHIEHHFKPLLGHLRIEELRPEHIEEMVEQIFERSEEAAMAWRQAMAEWETALAAAKAAGQKRRLPKRPKGRARTLIKPSSVKRIISTLRSALGTAVKKRRLPFNAAAHIELLEYTTPKIDPWSPAEAGQFLDAIQAERLAALYELVVLEGLRRGEACGLRWPNIELVICATCQGKSTATPCPACAGLGITDGVLRIRQQRVDVAGHIYEGAPKTKSGERVIEVGPRSLEVLMGWRLRQEIEADEWGDARADTDYVFTAEDGQPLRPENVSREFKRLTKLAGLRPIRLHDLRHLSASLQLAAGIDLPIASKRLGHSSVWITSDIYGHLLKGVGRAASDAAAGLIPRAPHNRDGHVTARGSETRTAGLPSEEDPQVREGAACRNRTDDLLITSELLWPTELRRRGACPL